MADLSVNTVNSMHSYLLEYYNEIMAGRIIAGRELIQTLRNLVDELDNPDYAYDTKGARRRISYMERFCKQTKNPYYGKPLKLLLCQKAFIEALFSFKMADTGLRRFRKAILMVGRKNFKSTLAAAIGMTEFMVGPGGMDICCSSNDDAQANIIFDEINNMRERLDPKNRRTHKNLRGILNLRNKSKIFKLSDRTRNKEGRNIDVGILDESHEMKTNVIAKSIEQSQSTKDEPLFINITTEGFVNDGYLDDELKYARRVLNGELEDPTLLVWLYTQDSEQEIWQDESSWVKSNPSLGVIKKVSYLRGEIRKAQQSKADRAFTLAKDFNIKQNNSAAWLTETEYVNEATYNMESLRGRIGLGAVDLSETTDLANAKVLIMLPGDPTKYIITKYFIPENKIESGSIEDKKNYLEWARQGLLIVSPGNENDFSLITAWFVSLYKNYGIRIYKGGYDNYNAKYWIREMEEFGFDFEKVAQEKQTMSDPMKLVEADLKSKLINYDNHEIDRWCLGNTSMKIDSLGLIMPVKVNDLKNRRIDGAVTLIILYCIYQRYRMEYLEMVR